MSNNVNSCCSLNCLLIKFLLLIALIECSNGGNGFLIIPKKADQNQTKVFDRDKTINASNMTLLNANTISDSSKNNLKLNKNSSSIIGEDINKLSNSNNNISQTLNNSLNKTNSNNYNETVNKAYFSTDNLTLVTTQVGSMVELPCTVHHIGDGMVSWIRKKDYHLLTVGLTTYSSDERFSALHLEESEDWPLKIKYVQLRDAGNYECQISTHPPISIFIQLNVVEARAEINGPSEKYLKPGSILRLSCRVLENIENPLYIFWYHNSRMINYDLHRGINVSTEPDNKYSELVISQTTTSHSGNYSCVTNNAISSSTLVHIFNGENPAAMQHGDYGVSICPSPYLILFLLVIGTYQMFCLYVF